VPEKERIPPNIANVYDITATVIDGTIRLTGRDLVDNVLTVPRGQDSLVQIADADGNYLYATEVPPGGERTTCWGRSATGTRRVFEAVSTEINSIVFAASTTNSASVTYGPVIKVKPQG
jgi:hypothetical protein